MIEYNELYKLTKDLKVLYVEDDENFQKETCGILDYFFTDVTLACDGEDGLKKYLSYYDADSKYFDIVITDINMPKMNGIELSKSIYTHNASQSIIVISAHDESHYLLELVNMRIEQFLQKPIVYDKILEVLHNTSKKLNDKNSIINNSIEKTIINLDGTIYWDKEKSLLMNDNEIIKLTKNEILLMKIFIKNKTQISLYQDIFNNLWADDSHLASAEALLPIVSRFRKKLPNNNIENIYGVGYRLNF